MILTSNYGLRKPEGADLVDVEDFNTNADMLDEKLAAVEAEMADVKKSVSDGKKLVADAITAQGTATAAGAAFETIAANVTAAGTARYNAGVTAAEKGNASTGHVLSGRTFTSAKGINLTGTMANRGAWTAATSGSGNVGIPAGYHNGSGYVSGAGAYNAGVAAADARANENSTNYKTGYNNGYNAGVAAADARANADSANYKAGYDAGYSKGLDDGYWNGYHAGYNDGKYA